MQILKGGIVNLQETLLTSPYVQNQMLLADFCIHVQQCSCKKKVYAFQHQPLSGTTFEPEYLIIFLHILFDTLTSCKANKKEYFY